MTTACRPRRTYRPRALRRQGQQRCNTCLEWKPATLYYFRRDPHVASNGLRCQCLDCEAAADRIRKRRKREADGPAHAG